ncbi:MAG: CPBP family intramembrane metalloprotease [Theionarchaea archaeon]|nr:CPBP family intramembrane metalloprotease [Theionarchaea archaeon]
MIFGLGHVPSYIGAGCRKTPGFFTFMIVFNLYASLIFGWLFWQYGLVAAMIGHMLFHVVWYPFDLKFAGKSSV